MEIFSLLAIASSMTGAVQYDYSNIDRVSYSTHHAQETLKHSCIPSLSEARVVNNFVIVPHYCGLEITTNVQTGKTTMNETTFDIVIDPETYSWVRVNFITNTK